jgi:ABC-type transporter Mla maintaining outer membrane lipid asymmetry permease subunit MlaE
MIAQNPMPKYFELQKRPAKFYLAILLGCSVILTIGGAMTYIFWQLGIEEKIFTNQFTTSVLLTDEIALVGAAAPWALISINWLACRVGIKKWHNFSKKTFGEI